VEPYLQNYSKSEQIKRQYHCKGCVGDDGHVRMVGKNVVLVYQVMARVVSEMVIVWGNSV
jgi:hypothetical protein